MNVGWFSLSCENLNEFQVDSQNKNLWVSSIVIPIMKT